jgi:hypothetical protein
MPMLSMVIGEILLGVLSNGLYDFIRRSGQRSSAPALPEPLLYANERIAGAVDKASQQIAELVSSENQELATQVESFLNSAEAQMLTRMLYLAVTSDDADGTVSRVKRDFILTFALYVGRREEEVTSFALNLCSVIQGVIRQAVTAAIADGVLSAHEALSVQRHHQLSTLLSGIDRKLTLLSQPTSVDVRAIDDFETRFRTEIAVHNSVITPPNLDAATRIRIDNIYVYPRIAAAPPKTHDRAPESIGIGELLIDLSRAVLLGNPGGREVNACSTGMLRFSARHAGLHYRWAQTNAHTCRVAGLRSASPRSRYLVGRLHGD